MFATKEQAQQACLELKSLLRDKYTMEVDGEKRQKERAAIVERYDNDVKKAQMCKAVYLLVFDIAGTIDNVIFYASKNELVFNWQDSEYHKAWTRREFYDFCRVAEKRSLVTENQIQFVIMDKVTGAKCTMAR